MRRSNLPFGVNMKHYLSYYDGVPPSIVSTSNNTERNLGLIYFTSKGVHRDGGLHPFTELKLERGYIMWGADYAILP